MNAKLQAVLAANEPYVASPKSAIAASDPVMGERLEKALRATLSLLFVASYHADLRSQKVGAQPRRFEQARDELRAVRPFRQHCRLQPGKRKLDVANDAGVIWPFGQQQRKQCLYSQKPALKLRRDLVYRASRHPAVSLRSISKDYRRRLVRQQGLIPVSMPQGGAR